MLLIETDWYKYLQVHLYFHEDVFGQLSQIAYIVLISDRS